MSSLLNSLTDKTELIPRINLTPSDPTIPFQMMRKQFPIKIAFAITINKAQGHTLQKAGLYLPEPIFRMDSYMWLFQALGLDR